MITAILFDLDGTLLDNDMDVFLPPYFSSLAARLEPMVARDLLLPSLLASTRAIMRSRGRRAKTNAEVFWDDFLPRLGVPAAPLHALIEEFYREDFDTLQRFTAARPDARPLVESAFAAGYTVVVATQPVFPLIAVERRLAWAGVRDFPYALITAFESMHTAKPDQAYYREICRMIAHEPRSCLMVGNDFEADIRPASAAGMRTFWLGDRGQAPGAALPANDTGTLGDVQRLIESGALQRS